jgi:hypothetical protein
MLLVNRYDLLRNVAYSFHGEDYDEFVPPQGGVLEGSTRGPATVLMALSVAGQELGVNAH